MFKKFMCLFLSLALAFACAGCSVDPDEPETRPAEEHLAQWETVEEVLSAAQLPKTAGSVCINAPAPANTEHLLSGKEASISYPFTQYLHQLDANPIAAFFELKNANLFSVYCENFDYLHEYLDTSSQYTVLAEIAERDGFEMVKDYRSGRDEAVFIRDVLNTSAQTADKINLEEKILQAIADLIGSGIHESEDEQVSYAYYVYADDICANVLCVYFHHDEEQELISDVEFQLLTLNYATYRQDSEYKEERFEPVTDSLIQMLSLVDAIEMNLTGTSLFHQYAILHYSNMSGISVTIPAEYKIGSYEVTISRELYSSDAMGCRGDGLGYEVAMLTNYRIHE